MSTNVLYYTVLVMYIILNISTLTKKRYLSRISIDGCSKPCYTMLPEWWPTMIA